MTGERAFGRVVVTVEAADPGAAREVAALLARRLGEDGRAVFRASADDFMRGAEVDRSLLRSALVDPFRAGESFALAGSRSTGDVLFDPLWTSAPRDACLIIDSSGDAASGADTRP